MNSWQLISVTLLSGFLVAGCNQSTTGHSVNLSSEIEQIDRLRSDLLALQDKVEALESNVATVSTEEEGYDVAKTKFGPFTVSTRGATPYLDGFKVKLRIGNLTNADFNGAKLNVAWGPQLNEKIDYQEWSNNQRKKEIALTTRLPSGAFTDVDIALTPAKAEDIKFFSVGIELNQLALRTR